MRTFPKLSQLPLLAFKRVVSSFSPLELLELSQCSMKIRSMLKKSIKSEWFELSFTNTKLCGDGKVFARRGFAEHQTLRIQVFKEGSSRFKRADEFGDREFLEERRKMRKTVNEIEIIVASDVLQIGGNFTDYIFDLFNVKPCNFSLYIELSVSIIESLKEWSGAREAMTVYVGDSEELDTATFGDFTEWTIRGKRKKFTLFGLIADPENLTPAHFPPLDSFSAYIPEYMSRDIFYNLDARVVEIDFDWVGGILQVECMSTFVKRWLEDVEFHRNLEVMFLSGRWEASIDDAAFRDIPMMEFVGERKPVVCLDLLKNYNKTINETKGKDIRRVADGRVATIIIAESFFAFIVRS